MKKSKKRIQPDQNHLILFGNIAQLIASVPYYGGCLMVVDYRDMSGGVHGHIINPKGEVTRLHVQLGEFAMTGGRVVWGKSI